MGTENKSREALSALFNKAGKVFTDAKVEFEKFAGDVGSAALAAHSAVTADYGAELALAAAELAAADVSSCNKYVKKYSSNLADILKGQNGGDQAVIKDLEKLATIFIQVEANDNILELDEPTLTAIEGFTQG